MADQFVALVLDAGNNGKKMDMTELTVGANLVERQRMNIADPATAGALLNVSQFHNADNQALGTFYGILSGGVAQVLNVVGNLDRARAANGDQLPATGVPASLSYLAQVFAPIVGTNTVSAGVGRVINLASTVAIKVNSVIQVDTGTNAEWCLVTAVNPNVSVTVANLALGHTTPYNVYPIALNMPRDAAGAADLANGAGIPSAVDYTYDGSAYQRARNAFALNLYTDTSASNATAGNIVTITLAGTPPAVAARTPCLIDALGGSPELAQIIAVNTGLKQITLETLASNHNGSVTPFQVAFPYQGLVQNPVNFGGWGLAADLAIVSSGLNATTGLQQFSVEKDVNAAGLTPTQGAASGAGIDADCAYGIFLTAAPSLTNKQMSPLQLDVAGNLKIAGNVASLATDSGSPVKVGAVYNTTLPTPTNGQRVDLQADVGGRLVVGADVASGAADAGNPIKIGGRFNTALPTLVNGQRGDLQVDGNGRVITAGPSEWAVNNQATAGTPSISKAAGGAGVRHFCTGVSFSVSCGATAQTPVVVNLRDGATGAGPILRTWALSAPVNSTASINENNLRIPGTANTAMTLEFAGATVAASIGSVNLNGYDSP
jgi:hypothetical protein